MADHKFNVTLASTQAPAAEAGRVDFSVSLTVVQADTGKAFFTVPPIVWHNLPTTAPQGIPATFPDLAAGLFAQAAQQMTKAGYAPSSSGGSGAAGGGVLAWYGVDLSAVLAVQSLFGQAFDQAVQFGFLTAAAAGKKVKKLNVKLK